jgi:hypothetical protein
MAPCSINFKLWAWLCSFVSHAEHFGATPITWETIIWNLATGISFSGQKSFSYRGVRIWNNLTTGFKDLTLSTFKKSVTE